MKKHLFLACFSLCLFAGETIVVSPKATFTYEKFILQPVGKHFEYFNIYDYKENERKYVRSGKVDKTHTFGGYLLTQDEKDIGSIYPELFSKGYFSISWRNFFVYDENEEVLGHIEGIYDTEAAAKYTFFDKNETPFAKAVLKTYLYNGVSQSLEFFDMEGRRLYDVERVSDLYRYNMHLTYHWKLKKTDEGKAIDRLFLLPFICAIMDVWW